MSKITKKFNEICNQFPNNIAIHYSEKNKIVSKKFKELHQETNQVANYLKEIGVKKGDKIFAFAPSNYKLCIYIMAAFKIGASIMYIDIFAKQESIKNIFCKYKPKYIIVSNITKLIIPFNKYTKIISKIINIDKKVEYNNYFEEDNIDESTHALLTTTTGQTGNPKIYIRTHQDLYNQLEVIISNIDSKNCNNILTTSYIYVFANLLMGKTTIMPSLNLKKSSTKLNNKIKIFKSLEIDTVITSPDFMLKIENIFKKLKTIYFGGAILNYYEANKIYRNYKNCNINYIYGSTECNIISINSLKNYIKELKENGINNLGKMVNGVEVKINDKNDIIVSGKNLLTINIEKENKAKEHITNDKGYLLNNELIYLGRLNNKITINNKDIYFNQIEQNIILSYPHIEKCAFLSKDNNYYLFIKKNIKNNNDIKKFLKNKYKIDTTIIKLKEIPCDVKHHTKIDYNKLRRIIK